MLHTNEFVLFTLINLSFSLVPIWKFDQNAVSFFSSDSPNYKEIIAFNQNSYMLKNIYTKNADGTISVTHKLNITRDGRNINKDVEFGNMQEFEYIRDYGQIICPQGKFMPLDADGNQISSISISNPHLDWHLKCVGHGTGVFLAFFLNKDYDALHGYLADKGKVWDGGNDFHNGLYDLKISNNHINNNDYQIIFLANKGKIALIGAKQTLKPSENVNHNDNVVWELFDLKGKTYAFFEENSDKFYILTYNNNGYSVAYSKTESIDDYCNYDRVHGVDIIPSLDLTFPFADKTEIVSMNFINKTPYIYYTIKNLATEKYNYGIMDLKTQQILFNTDQEITNFEPLSNYEMLIFSNGNAYKICLFRYGDSCVSGCPSGTSLVLDVNGNYCKSSSSEECALRLVPENICIDSCDTDIYKLNGNQCGLCEYFHSSTPYRLIKTEDCLATMPEGTKYYNEKYKLLECASGYQFDNVNKLCIPHCYNSCAKCTDYSEDSEDHKCSECKEGYYQNGTNCYEIIIPTTIIVPPTTVVVPPTTVIIPPTTVIKPPTTVIKPPTTIIKPQTTVIIPPTTEIQPPTTVTKPPTTIIEPPTTVTKAPTTKIVPPTTEPKAPTTIIVPPTTVIEPPNTIKKAPATIIEQPITIINKVPNTIVETPPITIISSPTTSLAPTTKPSSPPTKIPSTLAPKFPIESIQSTVLVEKCLIGEELNSKCKNLTNVEINTKLKEEILSSYSKESAMKVVKEEKIFVQATDTPTELRSLTLINKDGIPVIDLGYCEALLKEANNIPQDKNLIIVKLGENDDNNRNANLDINVYHPITLQKLNLSICDNTTLDLYVPLVMSSEQSKIYENLVDDGYDPFDLYDKFYRELCTPYTSENGTDVLLDEREEFVYSTLTNETNCYDNCKYVSYSLDNKYMRCECPVNETYTTLDVKHLSGKNIALSFLSVFKSTNYKVMMCYNLVFNFKIFCHNYGSILALICFGAYLIFMFYFCCKGISPLKVHISKIIFKETENIKDSNKKRISEFKAEKGLKFKEKRKSKISKDKGEQNPPKKFESLKIRDKLNDDIKNTEETKLVNDKMLNGKKKEKAQDVVLKKE